MAQHRKPTLVSKTVNTVRKSTNAVKAGVMKLKFWGGKAATTEAPVVEAQPVDAVVDAAQVEAKRLADKIASVPVSDWVPATMSIADDGSVTFTVTDVDGNKVSAHATPVTTTAEEQAVVDAAVEQAFAQAEADGTWDRAWAAANKTFDEVYNSSAAVVEEVEKVLDDIEAASALDEVLRNGRDMIERLQATAEMFRTTPLTVKEFRPEHFASLFEATAPAPEPVRKPGLLARIAAAPVRAARTVVKACKSSTTVSTETVETNVVEIADHLKGLTEFRALCSDRGETPCGWVTVYAVDRKAARRFVTDHAPGIASALFVLGGKPEITLHTGPFGIEAWEHRYPLGRRDFYIVRPVGKERAS